MIEKEDIEEAATVIKAEVIEEEVTGALVKNLRAIAGVTAEVEAMIERKDLKEALLHRGVDDP